MTKTTDKPLFTSLHNLEHHFTNEQDCWDYLVQTRWGKEPACPKCGSLEYYTIKGRKEFKCKDCKKFYNVLTGTLFENTKIPLIKWFKAIYLLTSHKKGISSHQLARDLGLTQKSGWFVLSRIRHLAQDKVPFMLSNTVQIDETYVGGKISNKHQSVRARLKRGNAQLKNENKTIVLGLVEQQGNIVNKVIPTTFSEHILPVIEQHVAKGSTMVTDDFKVYKGLTKLGYTHESVNHSLKEYVRDEWTTNTIEGYFSLLKRGIIGIYHQVSPKHLHRYCQEFTFRYNTRHVKENERFDIAIKRLDDTRLRYDDLIRAKKYQPLTQDLKEYNDRIKKLLAGRIKAKRDKDQNSSC